MRSDTGWVLEARQEVNRDIIMSVDNYWAEEQRVGGEPGNFGCFQRCFVLASHYMNSY